MIWIRKDGWPVVWVRKQRIRNFIRWFVQASLIATWRNRAGWFRSDGGLRNKEALSGSPSGSVTVQAEGNYET